MLADVLLAVGRRGLGIKGLRELFIFTALAVVAAVAAIGIVLALVSGLATSLVFFAVFGIAAYRSLQRNWFQVFATGTAVTQPDLTIVGFISIDDNR